MVGEEWINRATKKRNWRLLIENVMTEKEEEENTDNGNGNHGQLTSDDKDAKKPT